MPIMMNTTQHQPLPAAVMERFQQEYDLQTGGDSPLDEAYTKLLHEDETCWIVLYEEGHEVVTVIYKDPERRMESLEIT